MHPVNSIVAALVLVTPERFLCLTDFRILLIICLTRQPIRKVKSSRSGDITYLSRAAYLTRTERLYLFFRFRTATISSATVKITMNSSYVLISTTPFRKTRNGCTAALPAALVSILYCQCPVVPPAPHSRR